MSGDRLAQAKEAVLDAMDAGGDFRHEPVGRAGIAALDALVEIARKAERLVNGFTELQSLPGVTGTIDGEAVSELREALGVLDAD